MATVRLNLKGGKEYDIPNTSLSAVITALNAVPQGEAQFTDVNNETFAVNGEQVTGVTVLAAGSGPLEGEEPHSGHNPTPS